MGGVAEAGKPPAPLANTREETSMPVTSLGASQALHILGLQRDGAVQVGIAFQHSWSVARRPPEQKLVQAVAPAAAAGDSPPNA